jgi:hypothetical protein
MVAETSVIYVFAINGDDGPGGWKRRIEFESNIIGTAAGLVVDYLLVDLWMAGDWRRFCDGTPHAKLSPIPALGPLNVGFAALAHSDHIGCSFRGATFVAVSVFEQLRMVIVLRLQKLAGCLRLPDNVEVRTRPSIHVAFPTGL